MLAFSTLIMGCVFDSEYPSKRPAAQPEISHALDTLYPSGSRPDRIVALYQPFLDSRLGASDSSEAEISAPVNVKESASGEIVQYRLTRRRFGSWNPDREFHWNLFLLQSAFLFPGGVPDTGGLEKSTPALYQKVHAEDAFTNYFDSAAAPGIWDRITTSTRPGAIGIAVRLSGGRDTVLIQFVVAGSPAGKAGMAAGMAILTVNDSSVTGIDSAMIRFQRFSSGDSGTAVALTAKSSDGSESTFRMVREPVAFPTVITDSLQGVGYISVNGFTPNTVGARSTHGEFRDALEATRRFPATLIDLRDNGGGSLDMVIKMCDEILPGGVIIRQLQRRFDEIARAPRMSEISVLATPGGSGETGPDGKSRKYLLLANGGSASASEIFLVALKEGIGAPIMGLKTYGKGVGQTVRSSPGKGLALVTVLKFKGASGLDYHKHGLEPDFPDASGPDTLLANAAARALEMAGPLAKAPATLSAASRADLAARAAAIDWNRREAVKVPGPLLITE